MKSKKFDKIILLSKNENDEDLKFKKIFNIDKKNFNQANRIANVFQDAIETIKINGKEISKFNFNKALDIVNNHPEMAVVGTLNQAISEKTCAVHIMVDKVLNLLQNILTVTLTEAESKNYRLAITEAFTDLQKQSDDSWIFWQNDNDNETTYQYNILFVIQNENTGGVILALPISLTITVNVSKEKVFLIGIKDVYDYYVVVQSIEVVEALL